MVKQLSLCLHWIIWIWINIWATRNEFESSTMTQKITIWKVEIIFQEHLSKQTNKSVIRCLKSLTSNPCIKTTQPKSWDMYADFDLDYVHEVGDSCIYVFIWSRWTVSRCLARVGWPKASTQTKKWKGGEIFQVQCSCEGLYKRENTLAKIQVQG